jgi:hypothetical protein
MLVCALSCARCWSKPQQKQTWKMRFPTLTSAELFSGNAHMAKSLAKLSSNLQLPPTSPQVVLTCWRMEDARPTRTTTATEKCMRIIAYERQATRAPNRQRSNLTRRPIGDTIGMTTTPPRDRLGVLAGRSTRGTVLGPVRHVRYRPLQACCRGKGRWLRASKR